MKNESINMERIIRELKLLSFRGMAVSNKKNYFCIIQPKLIYTQKDHWFGSSLGQDYGSLYILWLYTGKKNTVKTIIIMY